MDRDPDEEPADDIEEQRGDQLGEHPPPRQSHREAAEENRDQLLEPVDREIARNDEKM